MFKPNIILMTIERDLRIAIRQLRETVNPLLFFILIVSLFPLAITPDKKFLAEIAPGVIWVAALLATLLSLDRLFRSDFEDGSLEQMLLSAQPLTAFAYAKIIAHWLVTGLPLIIIAPLLAMMLGMSAHTVVTLELSLLLGTPILSLIGSIGMALTVGLRGGGILLSLIVLPLYLPVLIFGSGIVITTLAGMPIRGELALLSAFLIVALTLAPLATAAALRAGMSYS